MAPTPNSATTSRARIQDRRRPSFGAGSKPDVPVTDEPVEAPLEVVDGQDLDGPANPASDAYRRRVSGRITAPVAAEPGSVMEAGRHDITLQP